MLEEYLFLGFLVVMVVLLSAWLVIIEKNRRAALAKRVRAESKGTQTKKSSEKAQNPKFVEPIPGWEFPENDGWEYPFATGKFIKSWYLDMDVLEEGISELGSRYRILKDNDTGVIYFYDRSGMTPLVKDYRRMRYA